MKKVEKVPLDTVRLARLQLFDGKTQGLNADSMPSDVYDKKLADFKNKNSKNYLSRLSDRDIKNFFAPLGYVSHEYVQKEENDPFVLVDCNDYLILFNDFTTRVFDKQENSENVLNRYAELTNTTVGNLVAFKVATELFGSKFPESYPEKKKKFDEKNLEMSYRDLPADMKKFLTGPYEYQKSNIALTYFSNQYGTPDITNIVRNMKDTM